MALVPPTTTKRRPSHDLGSALLFHKYLSPFQVEKLCYMFKAFFDLDKNNFIEMRDMKFLADKIQKYCKWPQDNPMQQGILDVLKTFFDCLTEQVLMEILSSADDEVIPEWEEALKPIDVNCDSISLSQWLNMWGRLCHGSAGLRDFPIWVQLLPTIFFHVIDADGEGLITLEKYRSFLKDFIGIPEYNLDKVVDAGFKAITADGAYKLDLQNFSFCFANFLLGKSIYGPGKYIFGVFDNRDIDEPFQVVYNDDDEDLDEE